jgi:hypothetical protein
MWSAKLPAIEQAGLQAIVLDAHVLGASRPDLGDIRLLDSTGAQVPYVIRTVSTPASSGAFQPYVLLRNEALPKQSIVEFERPAGQTIERLHIWIRPLDAEKKVRITGSDDRKAWFMVKDEHLVTQGARGDPPHQVLILDLPRSDYRYFRLALNDSLTAPMRVLGVGTFGAGTSARPLYVDAGQLPFTQRDSAGTTVLSVRNDRPVLVDRFSYEVADTNGFHRDGWLRTWEWEDRRDRRKRSRVRVPHDAERHTITSDSAPLIPTQAMRSDTFDLVIDNGDDRPLRFKELRAQVIQRLLLAELTPGMRYTLTTGDAALDAPRYDMLHFTDDLPVPVDTLRHGEPIRTPRSVAGSTAFDPSEWWVWAAILVLMLGMGWMAVRMLRRP